MIIIKILRLCIYFSFILKKKLNLTEEIEFYSAEMYIWTIYQWRMSRTLLLGLCCFGDSPFPFFLFIIYILFLWWKSQKYFQFKIVEAQFVTVWLLSAVNNSNMNTLIPLHFNLKHFLYDKLQEISYFGDLWWVLFSTWYEKHYELIWISLSSFNIYISFFKFICGRWGGG